MWRMNFIATNVVPLGRYAPLGMIRNKKKNVVPYDYGSIKFCECKLSYVRFYMPFYFNFLTFMLEVDNSKIQRL